MDSQNILSPGPALPGESFDLGLSDQELLDLSAREVTQMCANFSPEQIKARDSRTRRSATGPGPRKIVKFCTNWDGVVRGPSGP